MVFRKPRGVRRCGVHLRLCAVIAGPLGLQRHRPNENLQSRLAEKSHSGQNYLARPNTQAQRFVFAHLDVALCVVYHCIEDPLAIRRDGEAGGAR